MTYSFFIDITEFVFVNSSCYLAHQRTALSDYGGISSGESKRRRRKTPRTTAIFRRV